MDGKLCATCIFPYSTPSCKNLPKYPPQQLGPYYDKTDPNSVIKYRPRPNCIETFNILDDTHKHVCIQISCIVISLILILYFHTNQNQY